ncbi:exo-alpha-sialidase [Luteimonas sp. SJ-92]|uniref:Exo-alpha-sialidase n=1 Tax=Luteimonas salinisoli TaxID=2752307 RepID=A0A853JAL8_9GAMM|nr:sialidase family protein [Luteimonas salinisoli]NZA25885.1 exo-alpha-sialidase [Luteimonas salinisoli]
MNAAKPHIVRRFIPLIALALAAAGCTNDRDAAPAAADAANAPSLPTRVLDWPLPASTPGASAPDLALAPDGRILLSWLDSQPGRRHLFRFSAWDTAQQRWQAAPATIAVGNRMFVNWADTPHILATEDGALWAHWLQKTADLPYAYDVVMTRSRDGGANWAPPVSPHDDGTPTEHGFVSLWPQGRDLLGIAWLDGRNTGGAGHDAHGAHDGAMMLRTALFDAGLQPVHEATVDTRTCECCKTDVAMTDRGALLVYRGRTGEEIRDILATRLEGNVWTAPRRVHADDWTMPACPVNGPDLDARGSEAVVAWYTAAGNEPQVRMAHSGDAGDSFGAPLVLDRGGAVHGRVAVALDERQVRVLWLREESTGQSLWYARLAPDLSREFERIELARLVGRGRATGFPRLVVHGGIAHAVWTDVVDGRPQLRGARLLAAE